jgi:hypothetical protein
MRFVFIASGFVGFTLVALAGFSADRAADLILRDAAIGCVAGALIGRWFWTVVQNAVAQTAAERRKAAEAAAEAEAEAAKAQRAGKTKMDTRVPGASGSPVPAPAPPATAGSRSPAPAGAR